MAHKVEKRMSVLPVLKMGNPRLNLVSLPVKQEEFNTADLDSKVANMLATMRDTNGAGIAAIQVDFPLRVFIFGVDKNPRYPDAEPVPLTVLCNPKIEIIDATQCEYYEGCLSVPGLRGPVLRASKIRYTGFDQKGEPVGPRDAEGFHARVVLHELDHLDGVLFPARVSDFTRFGYTEELDKAGLGNKGTAAPPPEEKDIEKSDTVDSRK